MSKLHVLNPTNSRDASVAAEFEANFAPVSPFLPEPAYSLPATKSPAEPSEQAAEVLAESIQSPFVSEYSLADDSFETNETTLHRELMLELQDAEFEEALEDLVNDVRATYEARFEGENSVSAEQAEREMTRYLAPLQEEIEGMIDRMIAEAATIDEAAMTEGQLDAFLERMSFTSETGNPAFENFFGKVFKKIKKVAKRGVKAIKKGVKKGLSVVKKLNPLNFILKKLKKLARPFLNRVIKFGIRKLPPRFRPLARKLARKFVRTALRGEVAEGAELELLELEDRLVQSELLAGDTQLAGMPTDVIATEFDALITGYIIEGEDFDMEPSVVAYVAGADDDDATVDEDFEQAREKFIRNIAMLKDGASVEPHIEEFVPAILAGLKVALKIIGRKRVVNFLAKFVAQLIGRFVGRDAAKPLSRALVDAGLKLVNLESPEELEHATASVLAQVVRETVEGVVQAIPEGNLDDEAVLEAYALEAFEAAAARNFPPALLRRTLRPAGARNGVWQLFPAGRRRKTYKKFSRTFNVRIPPLAARELETFGGDSLEAFLVEQMGHAADGHPVEARLHLFELLPGATLSSISAAEKDVAGLGSGERAAWMQFHPLTRRAAAILLPDMVGLHSHTHPRFLATRSRLGIGQRLYFLEIPGARIARARSAEAGPDGVEEVTVSAAPAKTSEVNVLVDFGAKRIRVTHFLSEVAASRIAAEIRSGRKGTILVAAVQKALTARLPTILTGRAGGHLNVQREFPAREDFAASTGPALRLLNETIAQRITQAALSGLSREVRNPESGLLQQFVEAADHPSDGVTLVFDISGVDDVFAALQRASSRAARAVAAAAADTDTPEGARSVAVIAGYRKG